MKYHPIITFYKDTGERITQGSDAHGSTDTIEEAQEIIDQYKRDLQNGFLGCEFIVEIGSCWIDDDKGTTVFEC